ncbi:putative protein C16orf59 like [Crotalus adamanteus]|uniref:Uncharacterized protein n=1 Tax=Crotalus adamanteus TaxID=8729 RepID=A0AAW1AU32_CROAD
MNWSVKVPVPLPDFRVFRLATVAKSTHSIASAFLAASKAQQCDGTRTKESNWATKTPPEKGEILCGSLSFAGEAKSVGISRFCTRRALCVVRDCFFVAFPPSFVMLPADCAQRLVSLFNQALEDCTEQRTKIQQKIQQCRALLGDWDSDRENPTPEEAKNEKRETESSAEELKDLELLNKALEKALRVRSKFHQVPCETVKVSEGASGGDFAETGLQEPEVDPDPKALGEPCPLRTDPARKGTEPPVSTLQRNGSSLKLPLPYQKAFSKYVRLLEKCQDLKTDPEAAVPKRQFLERLQATFFSPTPAFTPAEVKQELVHLRELHLLITQHMEAESPEALGENPTWDREYESLMTLQALQEVVEQHLSKLDQMREALVSHAEFASLCLSDEEENEHDCLGFCHAPLGEQDCCDPDLPGPPPLLFYSSLDELKEMEALKLQVAMLNQKLQIQTAMETELLPLLEPGRLPEGSRPSVIRAMYSLLCEGGEHVPVLVKDEEMSS